MSVFNRISDIINANVNAILEQAEDPEKLVKMITQEMEETLVEVRSSSARYLADRKTINNKLGQMRREATSWETKAELAINKGRDDLAKAALGEKNRADSIITTLEGDLTHLDVALSKLKSDADQLEIKLQSAKARQKALIVRGQTAKSRIKIKRQINDVSFDAAFSRFDLYERKLDEMEGEIEAFDLGSRGLSDEIADLEKDEFLTAELEALKSKMSRVGTVAQIGPASETPQ